MESNAHAYSHIKHEKPALIILCLDMHERAGFQVLSMLKLDEDTRVIPLLTCLSEYELPAETTTFFDRSFSRVVFARAKLASNSLTRSSAAVFSLLTTSFERFKVRPCVLAHARGARC